MESAIIRLGVGLVLLVSINVALGSMKALFDGTFDKKKLVKGIGKGALVAACFVSFYAAGRLNPDIVAIEIEGEVVNVATAANLSMVTAYILYAKDAFTKLTKLVLSKTSGSGQTEEEATEGTSASTEEKQEEDAAEPTDDPG